MTSKHSKDQLQDMALDVVSAYNSSNPQDQHKVSLLLNMMQMITGSSNAVIYSKIQVLANGGEVD